MQLFFRLSGNPTLGTFVYLVIAWVLVCTAACLEGEEFV